MKKQSNLSAGVEVRLRAARTLLAVTEDYTQLDDALACHSEALSTQDAALLQAICYGVMRYYVELLYWLEHQADRPHKKIKPVVKILILSGLYQLKYMRIPAHAAIHSSVECAVSLQASRAKGFINAVLRSFQRSLSDSDNGSHDNVLQSQTDAVRYAHPSWMLQKFKADWPGQWRQIADNNNQQAPMTLRVNTYELAVDEYLLRLKEAGIEAYKHPAAQEAVVLKQPMEVKRIPGFDSGRVSVQDAAAQLAVPLLQHNSRHRVLDACAAPGGKTAHILQLAQPARLVALDNSDVRLSKVTETLLRLGQSAEIVHGNATAPDEWWDGKLFDRILLDAPCSASGVIRRHPDIKYLRSKRALDKIVKRQAKILDAMWQLLKPGGMLLYVTCSVFKIENEEQICAFMKRHLDAELVELSVPWGSGKIGRQLLPGDDDMDGFYFAPLLKS